MGVYCNYIFLKTLQFYQSNLIRLILLLILFLMIVLVCFNNMSLKLLDVLDSSESAGVTFAVLNIITG